MSTRYKYRHVTPTLSGLTPKHFLVLRGIGEGKSLRKMAKDVLSSITWVTYLVSDLVALGLAERVPVKRGQSNAVKLTSAGEKKRDDITNKNTTSFNPTRGY